MSYSQIMGRGYVQVFLRVYGFPTPHKFPYEDSTSSPPCVQFSQPELVMGMFHG